MKEILSYDKLKELFEEANERFLENNKVLIERNLSERCLCANLGYELRDVFKEYNSVYVDVEYNRYGFEVKEIPPVLHNDSRKIICDLIIHDRGSNNYLALEMKKIPTDDRKIKKDKNRLVFLTKDENFQYVIGIFYEIIISVSDYKVNISYYKDGCFVESSSYLYQFDWLP